MNDHVDHIRTEQTKPANVPADVVTVTPPAVPANRKPISKDTLESSVRMYISTGLIVRTLNGNCLTDNEITTLKTYMDSKKMSEAEQEQFFTLTKQGPWYNVNYVTELKRKSGK